MAALNANTEAMLKKYEDQIKEDIDLEKLVKKKQAAMFADQPGRAGGDDRGHIPDRDYAELGDGGDKLSAMAYAA